MAAELREFVFDFRDGSGPLTFYGRRLSARERIQIEAVRQTRLQIVDGQQIELIVNPTETLINAFLIRARDGLGARMFMGAAERERVFTEFDPDVITQAVLALNAMDSEPGN